jgi:hypothetical protein
MHMRWWPPLGRRPTRSSTHFVPASGSTSCRTLSRLLPPGSFELPRREHLPGGLPWHIHWHVFRAEANAEFGMTVDCFEFGSDTSRYQRLPGAKRSGVVFYTRPEAPRRGVELGLMAMELFALPPPGNRHPFLRDEDGQTFFPLHRPRSCHA